MDLKENPSAYVRCGGWARN